MGETRDPVMYHYSADPKHEQFRLLGGWQRRRSRPTSDTLTDVRSGP
jgi:hypothetical protein